MNKRTAPRLTKGLYRHNKSGEIYEVVGVALDTETNRYVVVYRPHSYVDHNEFFVRPYDMFVEVVSLHGQTVPRFEPVGTPRSFLA